MIGESGIEISETSRYSKWAQATWGLSFTTRHNVSKSFVTLDELPADTVKHLCAADAALYPELMKALGDKLSITLPAAVGWLDGHRVSHHWRFGFS